MRSEVLQQATRRRVKNAALRKLVESLLMGNREALLKHPAARRNHHAYLGGLRSTVASDRKYVRDIVRLVL